MNAKVYSKDGKEIGTIELPVHFREEVREDIIKRAYLAYLSHKRQPYGTYEYAGLEASAWTSKRRRAYRTSYGYGISRVPRAIFSRVSWGFGWVARVVPQAVKGRRAHPPKVEKIWYLKINKKEKRFAIRSAISASSNPYYILRRYENNEYLKNFIEKYGVPLIIDDIEEIGKIKDLINSLKNFGLYEYYLYLKETKRKRAGKGKMRGRKYKKSRGILIVTNNEDQENLSVDGLEVSYVENLNIDKLAPGGLPGRFIIWSRASIENLRNLYL